MKTRFGNGLRSLKQRLNSYQMNKRSERIERRRNSERVNKYPRHIMPEWIPREVDPIKMSFVQMMLGLSNKFKKKESKLVNSANSVNLSNNMARQNLTSMGTKNK